jgi:hypothetical protein
MEQDPLVCVAEIEQLADFIGGEAIDIAQGNDLALCRRQVGHGGADVRVQLAGQQCCSGWAARGGTSQCPGQRSSVGGRKRSGSTAGSTAPIS